MSSKKNHKNPKNKDPYNVFDGKKNEKIKEEIKKEIVEENIEEKEEKFIKNAVSGK